MDANQKIQADDIDRRRSLAFDASCEISCMTDAVKKLFQGHEGHSLLFGLMSRIDQCNMIVYNSMRVDGLTDEDAGRPEFKSLKRQFDGMLA